MPPGNDAVGSVVRGGHTGLVSFLAQEILATSYNYMAERITVSENWKTEVSHTSALGLKLVAFQLFNYYVGLLFTAFYGEGGYRVSPILRR
jgi:hypothetical protein